MKRKQPSRRTSLVSPISPRILIAFTNSDYCRKNSAAHVVVIVSPFEVRDEINVDKDAVAYFRPVPAGVAILEFCN